MLAGACWGVYPVLLPATTGAANDITLTRAISGPHTLAVGLAWWIVGMAMAIGYVVFVYSRFKGKVGAQRRRPLIGLLLDYLRSGLALMMAGLGLPALPLSQFCGNDRPIEKVRNALPKLQRIN